MSETPQTSGSKEDPGAAAGAQGGAAPAPESGPPSPQRRKFLTRITMGLGAISAASIMYAVFGFMIAPVFRKSARPWRRIGSVDEFPIGSTTLVKLQDASSVAWAGYAGRTAAWLRRDSKSSFVCFSINCTHLGCPVRWEKGSELFMCPCHGGVYYMDGDVAAGPPPEPLPRYSVRIRAGNVEVQASPIPITRGV